MSRGVFAACAFPLILACGESTPPAASPSAPAASSEPAPAASNNYGMPTSPPPDIQLSNENGTAMVDFGEVWASSPSVPERRITPGMTPGDYPIDARDVAEKQMLPKVFKCYTTALGQDGKQAGAGRVHLLLQIAPNGDVASVEVTQNTGLSPKVAECTSSAAKAARFMPCKQGGTVKIPFIFAVQR